MLIFNNHNQKKVCVCVCTILFIIYLISFIFTILDKSQSLEDGKHDFPFIFSLPHQLPSSFDNKHGHIRYSAKSRIFTFCGKDERTKKIFKVYSPINLNDEVLKNLIVSEINENIIN